MRKDTNHYKLIAYITKWPGHIYTRANTKNQPQTAEKLSFIVVTTSQSIKE